MTPSHPTETHSRKVHHMLPQRPAICHTLAIRLPYACHTPALRAAAAPVTA